MSAAPPRNGLGELSLLLGLVALAFSFFPVIGEFVAVPASVLAIGLGYVGLGRVERGLATNPGWAWTGIGLGLVAAFLTALVFVASSDAVS